MSIHSMQERALDQPRAGQPQAGQPRAGQSHPVPPSPPPGSASGEASEQVPSPDQLRVRLPQSSRGAAVVERGRRRIADVLAGRDATRLVVVVGPCSIHDPDAALEYARKLAALAEANESELVVVMRSYFEKPRSRTGWKGLISDPHLDGSCQVDRGLELAREILLAIGELGLPCASEVLDPLIVPYLEDLLSWAAIGARTVESQPHRELASGLAMPVGVKNGLDGQLEAAVNAIHAIAQPHRGLALSPAGTVRIRRTPGNRLAHLVLRGGASGPNYRPLDIANAAAGCVREDLARPVWVDCSHGNSGKDHRLQAHVCRAVLEQLRSERNAIGGLLIESNLRAGNQAWKPDVPLQRGVSITDACIGWRETEWLVGEIAGAVRATRTPPRGRAVPR